MIPTNFELLDNSKYFELYYKQELKLQSHMNILFKKNTFDDIMSCIVSFMKDRYDMNVTEHNAHIIFTTVICQGDKNVLTNLFGKPKNTIRLGEGRASVWFIKINDKIVMLFADTRGMSVELEPNMTQDEFKDIMTDLFEFLYGGYEKYNKRLIDFIKEFKIS